MLFCTEKKKEGKTRDVGTQSTLPYLSSSSLSPASTPSITDRSIKELEDSPPSNAKSKPDQEVFTSHIIQSEMFTGLHRDFH